MQLSLLIFDIYDIVSRPTAGQWFFFRVLLKLFLCADSWKVRQFYKLVLISYEYCTAK